MFTGGFLPNLQQPAINPGIFPKLFDTSVQKLQAPARSLFGTPVVSDLTRKEIRYLFFQPELNTLARQPLAQQATVVDAAKQQKTEPAALLASARLEAAKNNPLYTYFKQFYQGMSSKELYQQALNQNPQVPQGFRDMAFLAAERKANLSRRSRANFNNLMNKMRQPDDEAQRLSKEVEEQAQRIARQAAGLDDGGGEGGSTTT